MIGMILKSYEIHGKGLHSVTNQILQTMQFLHNHCWTKENEKKDS